MLKKIFRALLLFSATALPVSAWAISLGESTVLSKLGEQIRVEVEILQWTDIDLSQLEVVLASEANFIGFGLEYSPVVTDLELNILTPREGKLVILVTSKELMQDPFMEILLLLRWTDGSLLREYTFLFDPPRIRVSQPPQLNRSLTPEVLLEPSQDQELLSEPISAAELEPTLDQGLGQATAETNDIAEEREYQIRPGDSLWNVGLQFQEIQSDYNFFQMLLGIFERNPTAFENGNISLLKANQSITIPNSIEINAIDAETAEEVYTQLWEEGTAIFDTQPESAPNSSVIGQANEELAEERFVEDEADAGNVSQVDNSGLLPESLDEGSRENRLALTETTNDVISEATEVAPPNEQAPARSERVQQLESRVDLAREQLSEVQSITQNLRRSLEEARNEKAARQRSANRMGYILLALALSLTLGLVYFMWKMPKRKVRVKRPA